MHIFLGPVSTSDIEPLEEFPNDDGPEAKRPVKLSFSGPMDAYEKESGIYVALTFPTWTLFA